MRFTKLKIPEIDSFNEFKLTMDYDNNIFSCIKQKQKCPIFGISM